MRRRSSISSTQSHPRLETSHCRLEPTSDVRDTNTESLLTLDDRFLKKSRKSDSQINLLSRSYCFPNGEVFRPRNAPARRNKPQKLPHERERPIADAIPRSASMVLISSVNSAHSTAPLMHSGSYLTSLPSFNNLKVKLKQDLVLLIRNNKLDTPTNINIAAMAPPPQAPPKFQPRLFLLTNNRYAENSTNIVRLEPMLHNTLNETIVNGKNLSIGLNPSSLSNFNLNRSNSTTPQTSVSTTDNANDNISSHETERPVSLLTPSLEQIKESGSAEKPTDDPAANRPDDTLQAAACSPSEETVGLDSQVRNISSQFAASLHSRTPPSDASAFDSEDYASAESRKSEETDDRKHSSDLKSRSPTFDDESSPADTSTARVSVSEASISKQDELVDDLTFIPEETQTSPLEVEVDDTALSSNSEDRLNQQEDFSTPKAEQSDVSDYRESSGRELSPSDHHLEDNSPTDHQLKEDKLQDSEDSQSEDSQQNSQDYTQDTQDTTDTVHTFDAGADTTTMSSLKRSEMTSIADTTNYELPEPTIKLDPSPTQSFPDGIVNSSRVSSSVTATENPTDSMIAGSPNTFNSSEETPSPIFKDSTLDENPRSISTDSSKKGSLPSTTKDSPQVQSSPISKDSLPHRQYPKSMLDVGTTRPSTASFAQKDSNLIVLAKNQELVSEPNDITKRSDLIDEIPKTSGPAIPEGARKVVSLLGPADDDLKSVHHEFSKRKNIDLRLDLRSQSDTAVTATKINPNAPDLISENSYRYTPTDPAKRDLTNLGVLQTPTSPLPHSDSNQQISATPGSDFSFRPGEETLQRKLSDGIQVSEVYSQGQIEKLLTDDQKEVPPRGDLDFKGNDVKVHKRNTSSMSSLNSALQGRLPLRDLEAVRKPPSDINPPRSILQLQNRLSMLNVVNVDFDKSLPPSPERKNKYTGRFSLLGDPLASPSANSIPHKWPMSKENTPTDENFGNRTINEADGKWRSFKKVFKMFGSDTNLKSTKKSVKEQRSPERRAAKKSLMSSLRSSMMSNSTLSVNAQSLNNASEVAVNQSLPNRQLLDRPLLSTTRREDATFSSANLSKFAAKRKKFVKNLILGSAGHTDDLPSPVYSVRHGPETLDVPELERQPSTNYDLPNFEIGSDDFEDLLLKFDEVEQKAEQEMLVNPKSLNTLFLRDDELTKAQIVDQQKNDNQLSDESLPRKYSPESSEKELVSPGEEQIVTTNPPDEGDEIWVDPDAALSQMKLQDLIVELPSEQGEQRILLKKDGLAELLSDDNNRNLPSFLKHIKQFQDFSEVEIKVKDFDPTLSEKTVTNATLKGPILRSQPKLASNRNVEFSNTVFISETYPSHVYKRYNKSVTQYYLTEFAEVNRIKNELNAYKCHEMLVHEKSQMNTHFFY